jgi:hypothetical protein
MLELPPDPPFSVLTYCAEQGSPSGGGVHDLLLREARTKLLIAHAKSATCPLADSRGRPRPLRLVDRDQGDLLERLPRAPLWNDRSTTF